MDHIITHLWTFLFILSNCAHCGAYDGNLYLTKMLIKFIIS